jgi:hypothetical protein
LFLLEKLETKLVEGGRSSPKLVEGGGKILPARG